MKTKEQIEAEIKKLTEMKPNVRRRSAFGDDHHAAIDFQIDVLKDRLTEEQVEGRCELEEFPDNIRDAGLQAAIWMDGGEDEDDPSEEWASLLVPKGKG